MQNYAIFFSRINLLFFQRATKKTPEKIERLLTIAAYSLPSIEQEENAQLLADMFALYKEVVNDDEKADSLRNKVLEQKGSVKQCLQHFKQFVDKEVRE